MKAIAVEPDARAISALPGVSFADAYCVATPASGLDARRAAQAIFDSPPAWVNALMAVRNRVMGLFGVKNAPEHFAPAAIARVGMFPVVSETTDAILLGFDDRHLDFRIAVTLSALLGGGTAVTVSSVVLTHNRLGRSYLTVILPFHRLLARTLLSRAQFGSFGL